MKHIYSILLLMCRSAAVAGGIHVSAAVQHLHRRSGRVFIARLLRMGAVSTGRTALNGCWRWVYRAGTFASCSWSPSLSLIHI